MCGGGGGGGKTIEIWWWWKENNRNEEEEEGKIRIKNCGNNKVVKRRGVSKTLFAV